jgi:transposase
MDLVLLGSVCTCFLIFLKYFRRKALWKGVTREDLNQYAIGETFDRISEYDPTKLFMDIILHVGVSPRFPIKHPLSKLDYFSNSWSFLS